MNRKLAAFASALLLVFSAVPVKAAGEGNVAAISAAAYIERKKKNGGQNNG